MLDLEIIHCGFGAVDGLVALLVLTFHVNLETKVNNQVLPI